MDLFPLTYASMEPVRSETIQCGGEVRFFGPTLKQLWIITEYIGGSPTKRREEWRDVPHVPDPQ
jgi:hypothetical protein